MFAIYKYPIELSDYQTIMMPVNAKILCVQVQNGLACIWAQIERPAIGEPVTEARQFKVIGTGHLFHPDGEYVGTFQLFDGTFVGHLFEITKRGQ